MNINLGEADAGVAVGISVLNDYLVKLRQIGRLPQMITFQHAIFGVDSDITVLLDPPEFKLVQPTNADPYTRLLLTGTIEVRPAGEPDVMPTTLTLDAAARIAIVLVPPDDKIVEIGMVHEEGDRPPIQPLMDQLPEIGLVYEGPDGPPAGLVTEAHINAIFATEDISTVLEKVRIPLVGSLVEGLNASRFPEEDVRPEPTDWLVALTLMPAGDDTVDSFAVTAAPPGSVSAVPGLAESFVAPLTGLAVAYNRAFLDLMLGRGADAQEGETVDKAVVQEPLSLEMTDTAIAVAGHLVRPIDTPIIDLLPDVDIRFEGPMVPSLIRGTTGIAFDTRGIDVKVDEDDEIFVFLAKWFFTIGAGALLFTGWASLSMLGIALWFTAVQEFWNADAEIENAPNTVRDSLATALGAQLGILSDSLDDDTDVGELRIEASPDYLVVVEGSIVLLAQILVDPIVAMMQSAEYSKSLRRFVIFELNDGRRFRAQELARLMKAGKVTVPGFHQVDGNYLRANPDDAVANNLLQQFMENETAEIVVNSKRN